VTVLQTEKIPALIAAVIESYGQMPDPNNPAGQLRDDEMIALAESCDAMIKSNAPAAVPTLAPHPPSGHPASTTGAASGGSGASLCRSSFLVGFDALRCFSPI
jgi:hypothetical protein